MSEELQQKLRDQLWEVANKLRGNMSASDFMYFTLGFIFYKYLSEKIEAYANNALVDDEVSFKDLWTMEDEDAAELQEELKKQCLEGVGYFIEPTYLFSSVIDRIKKKENILPILERSLKRIEDSTLGHDSEEDFGGLFSDIDLASPKLGKTAEDKNTLVSNVLLALDDIKFGVEASEEIDILGDAYEYLMSMYASNAGKSGGEFFTPSDVSELLTRLGTVGKTEINKVYDPACGSGSLLLKALKVLGKDAVRNGFFGQEINITTYNLCRINMFLHDVDFDKFDIACEDTLIAPQHWDDEPFELIVSNPPYSIKWVGDDNPVLINDPRFSPAGVLAPRSKADFAFIMHSLAWLATNGTAAIVCFPGIMYRGGAEQKIRQYLVGNNFIDSIIQLPSNLFFGAAISTCIMVMKKGKTDNKTLFIDASKECIKVTNNNKLTPENIKRIVEAYTKREDEEHFSHLASLEEIVENNYNLSVSTYVEAEDTREKIDIKKLNAEIDEIVAREQKLREEVNKIIAEIEVGHE